MNKAEAKYIVYSVLFAVAWFVFIMPYLLNKGIENSNPYYQFIFFNIGLFIFLQIFLKSITLNSRMRIASSLGIIILFMAMDIWVPPFSVSPAGVLLGTVAGSTNLILVQSSSDYVLGYMAINTLGLTGQTVFIFTYIIAPLVILFLAAKILPNFVRNL